MGLFDLFKGKGDKRKDGQPKRSGAVAKWGDVVANKRAQAYDRAEAIEELCKLKTPEAVEALMRRFNITVDPSITDQEEKEYVYDGILAAGREVAVAPVRAFALKAESLAWPMKILKQMLSEEELVEEMLGWLSKWDTEYAKFIDPKLTVLSALEEHEHPKIREAVEPFLQDVSEPARFHAAATTLAQKDPEATRPLLDALLEEESVRIRNKIADGFAELRWTIPDEMRDSVRKVLPYQFSIDGEGLVRKRA
jgi:HEAT repeat protein